MSTQELETEAAASVVFRAVTIAYPCQDAAQSKAPNQEACKAGFDILGNAWANSFQKQAVLETLRNSGCLQ